MRYSSATGLYSEQSNRNTYVNPLELTKEETTFSSWEGKTVYLWMFSSDEADVERVLCRKPTCSNCTHSLNIQTTKTSRTSRKVFSFLFFILLGNRHHKLNRYQMKQRFDRNASRSVPLRISFRHVQAEQEKQEVRSKKREETENQTCYKKRRIGLK